MMQSPSADIAPPPAQTPQPAQLPPPPQIPAPALPPLPARAPGAPGTPAPGSTPVFVAPGLPGGAPNEVYEAQKAARDELRQQLRDLEEKRQEINQQIQQGTTGDADKKGLEQRLADTDARIASVEKQIEVADKAVANAAAMPGAVVPPPPYVREGPPEEVFVLSGMFIVFVFFPLAIAAARRMWKRAGQAVTTIPADIYERFNRLEQGMEAVAVEVERIGEGQRFMTKVLSEGPAEPIAVRQREQVPVEGRR